MVNQITLWTNALPPAGSDPTGFYVKYQLLGHTNTNVAQVFTDNSGNYIIQDNGQSFVLVNYSPILNDYYYVIDPSNLNQIAGFNGPVPVLSLNSGTLPFLQNLGHILTLTNAQGAIKADVSANIYNQDGSVNQDTPISFSGPSGPLTSLWVNFSQPGSYTTSVTGSGFAPAIVPQGANMTSESALVQQVGAAYQMFFSNLSANVYTDSSSITPATIPLSILPIADPSNAAQIQPVSPILFLSSQCLSTLSPSAYFMSNGNTYYIVPAPNGNFLTLTGSRVQVVKQSGSLYTPCTLAEVPAYVQLQPLSIGASVISTNPNVAQWETWIMSSPAAQNMSNVNRNFFLNAITQGASWLRSIFRRKGS